MRVIVARSSHDHAWHSTDLVDAHVRTLIPIACNPPSDRLGLKLFNFFVQKTLREQPASNHCRISTLQRTTRFSSSALSKVEYGAGGFGRCFSPKVHNA